MHPRRYLAILITLASVGCGPKVDLTKGLQVTDVSTGWRDVGIVDGQNKIVPTISFALKNVSDQTLTALDVNVNFYHGSEDKIWDSAYARDAGGTGGLVPGAATKSLTFDSGKGYTGTETRADMLRNSEFQDARVIVAAKYGRFQLVTIANFPVTRRLITK